MQQHLLELNSRRKSGFGTVGSADGKFLFVNHTPAEVEQQHNEYEQLIQWIKDNCELTPQTLGLDMPREEKDLRREALKPEFFDSMMAVSDGRVLVSEDLILRSLAKNEHDIEGCSLQTLLAFITDNRWLSTRKYTASIAQLAEYSIEFVRVTDEVLWFSLRKAGWRVKPPFTEVVHRLGTKNSDFWPMIKVATKFMKRCVLAFGSSGSESFISATLTPMVRHFDVLKVLSGLSVEIRDEFGTDSANAEILVNSVLRWHEARRIIPFR